MTLFCRNLLHVVWRHMFTGVSYAPQTNADYKLQALIIQRLH